MKQQHVYYLLQPPLPPLSLMQVFKSDGSLLSWFWNGGGGTSGAMKPTSGWGG